MNNPAPSVGEPQELWKLLRTIMVECTHWEGSTRPEHWSENYWRSVAAALARKGVDAPTSAAPHEEADRALPYSVDADRLKELLGEMHKPGCVPGDDDRGETSCNACLCSYALVRLLKKIDATSAAPHAREALTDNMVLAGLKQWYSGWPHEGITEIEAVNEARLRRFRLALEASLAARAPQGGDAALLRTKAGALAGEIVGSDRYRRDSYLAELTDQILAITARPEGAAQQEANPDD